MIRPCPHTLVLDGIRIALGDDALISISARIEPGAVLTVMGPSGSGKSTLLHALAGTLAPAFALEGSAWLDGEDLLTKAPETRALGLLFQDPMLFPHLSVIGNLMIAIPRDRVKARAERIAACEAALATIGLEGYGQRDPATLSGGQAARVALQRTLLSEPRALLLDEPFSKLDAARRSEMRDLVFSHAKARNLPVLLVTHDPVDAAAAGGPMFDMAAQSLSASASV